MSVDEKMHLALRPERRRYTCTVCGASRDITVRRIEKTIMVCLHQDTQGGMMPVMALREEGQLIVD